MHRRATGSGGGAQEEGQQDQGLVEAQAHGQGRDGKLLLLGQRELDGLAEPVPELGVFAAEGVVLLDQLLAGGSAAVLGLDGGQHLLGMVVSALAATAVLFGGGGDGAVGAGPARGGIGDPTSKGYGTHGDGSS